MKVFNENVLASNVFEAAAMVRIAYPGCALTLKKTDGNWFEFEVRVYDLRMPDEYYRKGNVSPRLGVLPW